MDIVVRNEIQARTLNHLTDAAHIAYRWAELLEGGARLALERLNENKTVPYLDANMMSKFNAASRMLYRTKPDMPLVFTYLKSGEINTVINIAVQRGINEEVPRKWAIGDKIAEMDVTNAGKDV